MDFVVADFETTTNVEDCRVWAWAICDPNDLSVVYGNSIESFINSLNKYNVVYFHNLAFDGSFILDYLLKNGFSYTNARYPKRSQLSTLIDDKGKFYTITVNIKGHRVTFKDSLKRIPMSVAAMAKMYDMPLSKGHIDYTAPREVGHELTSEEIEYIRGDVVIVANALKEQYEHGMTKLTAGSNAFNDYKTKLKKSKVRFRDMFPIVDDTLFRSAYRGGFTYCDPRFRNRHVGEGTVYDVNSLYPSVMYNRVLPYGYPILDLDIDTSNDYPLAIIHATITAKLKKDHIPCIQIKGSSFFIPTDYVKSITEPTELYFTNVDLELWRKQYNIDILDVHNVWHFHGSKGFFTEYIDKWMAVKQSSTGGKRAIAKLMLNSLYGKFATNPTKISKYPSIDDGVLSLELGEERQDDPVYTAMGIFITAYARSVTINAAQSVYGQFCYADTDSLHVIGDCNDRLDVDQTRLGAWKIEQHFVDARFMRAKAYVEKVAECTCHKVPHERGCGFVTHIAGLPVSVAKSVTFDDLTNGHVFHGKLLPKRVPGGIVLTEAGYTLKF